MTAMHETPDDETLISGADAVGDDTGESQENADTPAAADAPSQTTQPGPAGRSANMGHT